MSDKPLKTTATCTANLYQTFFSVKAEGRLFFLSTTITRG